MQRRVAAFVMVLLAVGAIVWFGWQRNAHVESPLSLDEQFAAGLQAVSQGDVRRARIAIDSLDVSADHRDHARVLRAAMALKLGNPTEAVRQLAAKQVREEVRVTAALILASAFHQLQDFTNAEQAARFVVGHDPKNVEGHRLLAAIYYDLGANDAAISELRVVNTLDPEDFRAHHLRGQILFDAENYNEAISAFRAALKLNPPPKTRREITLSLAQALLTSNRFTDATALLRVVPAEDASLLALKSEALWAQGKREQADILLRDAARIEPRNRFVLLLHARIAIQDGRFEQALEPLKKHLEADPHDIESRHQLALCYQKLGRPERYEAEANRLKETKRIRRELSKLSDEAARQPRNAEVRDRIAILFRKLGRTELADIYQRAAEACRRFRSRNPRTPMRQEGDSLERR